jgi:hypothetical protein
MNLRCQVLLEKPPVARLHENYPIFMELENLIPLALTSPTSGGRSVGIVRSRTKATELVSSREQTICLYTKSDESSQ